MQKNGKFQGSKFEGKFDWKSRGVNFKKIDILNMGVANNNFLEKSIGLNYAMSIVDVLHHMARCC